MISEEDFVAAAGVADPQMAFARLETRFRKVLEENFETSQNNYSYNAAVIEYMNHTIAAAQYFNFDFLDFYEVPDLQESDVGDTFHRFTTLVDAFKVRVQLAHIRKPIEYSVGLSTADKDKLRFYVAQMKTVIDAASVPEPKRDALLGKLNKFLAEVDKNRAPWDRFGDVVIHLASVGGEAAEKLEPARKWIDSIAKLLGQNKEIEDSQLQIPSPPKKIEDKREPSAPPPPRKPRMPKGGDVDEEIPF